MSEEEFTFTVGSGQFTDDEIAEYVRDSVCDGYCSECDELVSTVEPDAHGYDCPSCDGDGTVASVLVMLGLC